MLSSLCENAAAVLSYLATSSKSGREDFECWSVDKVHKGTGLDPTAIQAAFDELIAADYVENGGGFGLQRSVKARWPLFFDHDGPAAIEVARKLAEALVEKGGYGRPGQLDVAALAAQLQLSERETNPVLSWLHGKGIIEAGGNGSQDYVFRTIIEVPHTTREWLAEVRPRSE